MYTLVSAIGRPLTGAGRWASVAIGDVPLTTVYATYARVIATLSNPFLTAPVALDLNDIRAAISGQSITLNQYLSQVGSGTLPTTDTLPVINTRYAKYMDVFRAGYSVTPISPTAAVDTQLPAADKTWLYLSRTGIDFKYFYQSCLVSINGFYHFLDADANGAYVRDGMVSRTLSHEAQIGMVSFAELGTLTYVDITADMIYKQDPTEMYKNRVYVDIGQDITDKTVMLVLGGYLHVLDDTTYKAVGSNLIQIDIENLPFLDRYYESRGFIDLTSLPLTKTPMNESQVAISEIYSDASIEAYLALSQSFFVILDNDEIFVDTQDLNIGVGPGMYISYVKPIWPIRLGAGRTAEYWSTYEDTQWSVTVKDNFKSNRLYWTTNPLLQNSVANSQVPLDRFRESAAQYLKIGRDI